jgi:hypothetical protein
MVPQLCGRSSPQAGTKNHEPIEHSMPQGRRRSTLAIFAGCALVVVLARGGRHSFAADRVPLLFGDRSWWKY